MTETPAMLHGHMVTVACPTCFEHFEVAAPAEAELPCDVDYDCEVCCSPMRIAFFEDGEGEVRGDAYGLNE